MSIVKIGKVRKLRKVPAMDRAPVVRERVASAERIPVRRGRLGHVEDPLESQALQGVEGTLPERIVWKALEAQRLRYEVQRPVLGGRLVVGGSVLDFVVYGVGAVPVALRVQGDYWHGPAKPEQQAKDDRSASRLRAYGYRVVDLWETDIYQAARWDRVVPFVREAILR